LVRLWDQIWKFYQSLGEILPPVQINKNNILTEFIIYDFAYVIDSRCLFIYLFIVEINL